MAIGCKQPRVAGLHGCIFSSFNGRAAILVLRQAVLAPEHHTSGSGDQERVRG
jgi:hypothetical protein